jgi:hypothetical protein
MSKDDLYAKVMGPYVKFLESIKTYPTVEFYFVGKLLAFE